MNMGWAPIALQVNVTERGYSGVDVDRYGSTSCVVLLSKGILPSHTLLGYMRHIYNHWELCQLKMCT